eukprot:scaffold157298_cov79-Cyclotella_meneghiniana.AAC.1
MSIFIEKKIALPAAASNIFNAARSVLSPSRNPRGSQQDDACNSSSPVNARSHRDAISAVHPLSGNVVDTPIPSMRRLLLVRPPSPPNQSVDESNAEEDVDDDNESLPATQPPEIAFTDTSTMPSSIFADKNKNYEPPDHSNYPSIPTKVRHAIKLMLKDVWGIHEPRGYQVTAIFYMAFLKTRLMYLIRKTCEGKSLRLGVGTKKPINGGARSYDRSMSI